ncbi:urease accessory protein UreD [Salipiger sp. 1_MG-2023]|uniref:urease accessory protein UreD n=1 Tax=Salipiger sp. 1_MG-2023 TaxID=3062665 RepID=UPI0026E43AA1|nr:urease accessory protein UreD [Salipiger sp. 1_MG-2023]MDO6587430.1 urease accessory protein UreD [Salipiger sp. 1_MG-2023]
MKDFATQRAQVSLICGIAPDGGTSLLDRHVEWPWSLPRGYRRAGLTGPLTVLPQCAGAALLPGDHWRHEVTVQAGGSVDLLSAGALMIHADARRGRECCSDWTLRADRGATLRHLADPNVLMSGAKMHQRITLTLDVGARAVLFDGFCRRDPAAPDAGGVWKSDLQVVRADGHTLFRERQHVTEADLIALKALPGGMTAFGTVTLIGSAPFENGPLDLPDCYAAAGAARGGAGQILRIAATTGGALDRAFRQIRTLI